MVIKGLPMATERLGQTWRAEDAGDITGQLPKQNKKWGSLRQWGVERILICKALSSEGRIPANRA